MWGNSNAASGSAAATKRLCCEIADMFLKLRSRWRAGGGKRSIGCDNMKGRSKKKRETEAQKNMFRQLRRSS